MTWIDFFLPYRGFRVVTKPYTVFTLIVTFFFLFCHITRQGFQQTTSIKSVTQKGIKYNVTKITYMRYTYLHEIRKIIGLISYYNNVRKSMSLAVRKLKSACRKHCKWQETSFPGGGGRKLMEIHEEENYICRKVCGFIPPPSCKENSMFHSFR